MIKIEKEDILELERDLAMSLVNSSNKKISSKQAEYIASVFIKTLDFSKPAVSHKSINFYAKEILYKIDISKLPKDL